MIAFHFSYQDDAKDKTWVPSSDEHDSVECDSVDSDIPTEEDIILASDRWNIAFFVTHVLLLHFDKIC